MVKDGSLAEETRVARRTSELRLQNDISPWSHPLSRHAAPVVMASRNDVSQPPDVPPEPASQVDLTDILRRRRKARGQRACHPCRQRKVKCNYETPCKSCNDRAHPDLCLYHALPKQTTQGSRAGTFLPKSDDHDGQPGGPNWSWVVAQLDNIEHSLRDLKNFMNQHIAGDDYLLDDEKRPLGSWTPKDPRNEIVPTVIEDVHTHDYLTGEMVYLGANSVPAMVVALGSGCNETMIRDLLSKSVLPLFGLDNQSATYPFVDLWGLPHGSSSRINELCKLVPADADCLQYFRQYRDTAHVLFPGVADITEFESDLMQFLNNRTRGGGANGKSVTEPNIYGMSLHWIGLLFATLASGCQCSGMPRKERQLTSQVYGKICMASTYEH